jgi:hypothetical protein
MTTIKLITRLTCGLVDSRQGHRHDIYLTFTPQSVDLAAGLELKGRFNSVDQRIPFYVSVSLNTKITGAFDSNLSFLFVPIGEFLTGL